MEQLQEHFTYCLAHTGRSRKNKQGPDWTSLSDAASPAHASRPDMLN